jgi:HD-GYP domain-containing protein (c-di-GMP phosphodiesterase class II)
VISYGLLMADPAKLQPIRLSEVLSALSYGLDLTEGQPQGHALRTCLIGMRLAEELRLDSGTRAALYYALILKDAGGSSDSTHVAGLFGSDDHVVKYRLKLGDWSGFAAPALCGLRSAGIGQPVVSRVRRIVTVARWGREGARDLARLRCERGAAIVHRLGFPPASVEAIRSIDERWDGRGHPDGLRGDQIPLLARIAGLAQMVDVYLMFRGVDDAMKVARERRGRQFDPDLVDVLIGWRGDTAWWERMRTPRVMPLAVAAEPADHVRRIDESGLDDVAGAFAQIIDAKTPFTFQHSSRVAAYAQGAAGELGLDGAMGRRLGRAGLLHDIGILGVSNRILEKPCALIAGEWRAVRRHPVYTWEILSKAEVFSEFARMAALHHERMDGSGYPWHLGGSEIDLPAGILAVASAYDAMTSWRPYCASVPPDTAVFLLEEESGRGFAAAAVAGLSRYLQRCGHTAPSIDLDAESDETDRLTSPPRLRLVPRGPIQQERF